MNTSLNQLCVIDGEYKIKTEDCANRNEKLTNLIESYQLKLKNNQIAGSDNNDFVLLHSKDGSELCTSLLQSLGAYDFDSTMNSTLTNNDKSVNLTQRFTNTGLSNFVCFLISDFDQNDCVFLKLEETQAKLSSIFNSLNNTASTTLTNNTVIHNITNSSASNSQISFNKRFLIFGWPVLNYCLQNNIVRYHFHRILFYSKFFKDFIEFFFLLACVE